MKLRITRLLRRINEKKAELDGFYIIVETNRITVREVTYANNVVLLRKMFEV